MFRVAESAEPTIRYAAVFGGKNLLLNQR